MDLPKGLIPKEMGIVAAFVKEVGRLDYFDLQPYKVEPKNVVGGFWKDDIPMLFELCKKHPELHIISRMPDGEYRNCFIPGASSYRLGDGDANPELRLELPAEVKRAVAAGINHMYKAFVT